MQYVTAGDYQHSFSCTVGVPCKQYFSILYYNAGNGFLPVSVLFVHLCLLRPFRYLLGDTMNITAADKNIPCIYGYYFSVGEKL